MTYQATLSMRRCGKIKMTPKLLLLEISQSKRSLDNCCVNYTIVSDKIKCIRILLNWTVSISETSLHRKSLYIEHSLWSQVNLFLNNPFKPEPSLNRIFSSGPEEVMFRGVSLIILHSLWHWINSTTIQLLNDI